MRGTRGSCAGCSGIERQTFSDRPCDTRQRTGTGRNQDFKQPRIIGPGLWSGAGGRSCRCLPRPEPEGGGAPEGAPLSSRLAAWRPERRDARLPALHRGAFRHPGPRFSSGARFGLKSRAPPRSVSEPVAGGRSAPGRVPGAARALCVRDTSRGRRTPLRLRTPPETPSIEQD
jgi:hypothetical protein